MGIAYFDEEGDSIKVTSGPEFEEALNYAKQSECFLPIVVNKEEAPEPEPVLAPQEEAPAYSPVFDAEDFFKRFCGFSAAPEPERCDSHNASEPAEPNPFFRALAEGASIPQEIEQAAQNFLPMFAPLVESLKKDFFASSRQEEAPIPIPVPEVAVEIICPRDEPKPVAHAAICDKCEKMISGIRYKCLICPDYDLCEACEATNLEEHIHDANHVFAKIRDPAQRHSPIFHQQGRPLFRGGCGRGKFGGRRRVEKLENDVATLQEQVAALIAKRREAEQQKEEPAPVPEEEGVLIEDVPEEEVNSDISVNIQPLWRNPLKRRSRNLPSWIPPPRNSCSSFNPWDSLTRIPTSPFSLLTTTTSSKRLRLS